MYFFFEGKGSRQLELLLVEAANGVTSAIQGLNICSGVITPRILERGIFTQDSRGGIYPQDSRGVFTPRILEGVFTPRILGGVNNPNNPPLWPPLDQDILFSLWVLCKSD